MGGGACGGMAGGDPAVGVGKTQDPRAVVAGEIRMKAKWMITIGFLACGCVTASDSGGRYATGDDSAPPSEAAEGPPAEAAPPLEIPPVPDPPAELDAGSDVIGQSVEGRPIHAVTLGDGPRTVLYLASIHGNEAAGTPLVNRLLANLYRDPGIADGWRVIVLPVANPDGLAASRRHNSRDVDLNRNFPAENREERERFGEGALSEPESQALHELILEEKPDLIVSVHQPLECVDYDGPGAEEVAERMAAVCHLPAKKLGARPGSLGAWAGETMGIPTITLELPREAGDASSDPDELWDRYGAALLAAME